MSGQHTLFKGFQPWRGKPALRGKVGGNLQQRQPQKIHLLSFYLLPSEIMTVNLR